MFAVEKKFLMGNIDEIIKNDFEFNVFDDDKYPPFKTFFKLDEYNCYRIFDKEYSIKTVFEKSYLENFLRTHPTDQIDVFDCI